MILDQYGSPLPELLPNRPQPRSGRWLLDDPNDRNYTDVSRDLSPERVDSIMSRANQGDAADQAELANLLLEKNHEIKHAFSVRVNSILGLKYTVEPGDDDSPEAKAAAEAFQRALKNCGDRDDCDGFRDLLRDMMRALLVGYSVNEIVWGPGGNLLGFVSVPARNVNFISSFVPTIRLSGGAVELPLEPDKFVYLATRENGSDPARGGLVRPLAWLHCFLNVNIKDLLSFIESYAMPVIIAKVSDSAFESELTHLMNLIRSFGPNGGGIVSQGTELSTIQAPNVTGEVYFRVIEYIKDAITRLILGQTASSGDGGGLSKDNAQDKVRQDILEADATMLADCINRKIAAPWCRFNFGVQAACPRLVFVTDPPEDVERAANVIRTMYDAGWEADQEEVSARLGFKFTRRTDNGQTGQFGQIPTGLTKSPASGELQLAEARKEETPQSVLTWLGPVLDELSDLADGPDEKLQEALGNRLPVRLGDSGGFENMTVKTGLAAAAHGIAEQYDKVKRDGRVRSGKPMAEKTSQSSDGEKLS